ncbi:MULTISPECIES: 30S ribosomal protein S3 [Haloferax]|uniref:Small ribosomal subunit protein uS3 n=1 Tax=Haloferax massiliensis TaxID=1476858 RepID=A0A0D6JWS4_9EURY|nr:MULTISPECIES: 30S ribosomal protein S3 [Haloferax]MDS0240972.1 30S ribosomal protein S3 [Haloferax sp. S2CR25]MDS0444093.1 30S ribosomal protein S3 [Haloferax sp. S2CR25-2]CQR53389.1 30S ribosomal protein S3 [Haloferax massiliensis]
MADEHQFIENGLQRSQIDEFFAEELGRAGYGGMDVAKTPMGTQIVLKAEKPGMVIGKGGKNIRKVTRELEERFNLDDPQIDVQEVDEPDLNARIVADRLANALERGWYFRKAGHTTIDRIMDAGALGAEIVLSGKVTGARSRVEKFNRGYIKHNGEPAQEIVDEGQGVAVMKLGTIGVTVKIIPPGARLPDDFEVEEDANPDAVEQIEETESVEDLLEEEPEEVPDVSEEADADAETDAVDEDVVEEAAVEAVEEEVVDDEADDEDDEAVEEVVDDDEELDEDVAEEAADLVAEMEDEDDDETEEE